MDKSRQRNAQKQLNQRFIIKSKKLWWREAIVLVFTLMIWFYCATVICFFIDAVFSINGEYPRLYKIDFKVSNADIKNFFIIIFIIFIVIYLSLRIWILYNKKRFGKLTRRTYPEKTTKEDFMGLNMIDEATFEKLQCEKIIILETNPIRDGGN